MVNLCLGLKKIKMNSGELSPVTYTEYCSIGKRLIRVFGRETPVEQLGPGDFVRLRGDFQSTHKSIASLKGDIQKTKVFFNFALEEGHIERAARYGQGFKGPSAAVLRKAKLAAVKMFSPEQILAVLRVADPTMQAMTLLGINCGYGNHDCATLMVKNLDLRGGWANHPRPKTGIVRRSPLWPETVAALREVVGCGGHVFLKDGKPWLLRGHTSPVAQVFGRLLKANKIEAPSFYGLRHTFATVALRAKDRDAVKSLMGHAHSTADILEMYNEEGVSDERLLAVTNYVHGWLYGST
jgi:integrase